MSAKKGLGRGFDSLIPSELLDESFDPGLAGQDATSDLRSIRLVEIHPDPTQPRKTFHQQPLDELAASIKEHGVFQPIVVTPRKGKDGYTIVAGERRYRASKQAGLDKIPAIVRTLSDQHKLELSLIENVQRQDLNVIETAYGYQVLRNQFNLSLEEIGKRVGGKSTSAISNTLRLLKLPSVVRDHLAKGELTEGQARPLVNLDEAQIADVAQKIIAEQWSAREVERYIAQLKTTDKDAKKSRMPAPHQHKEQAKKMSNYFAMPVSISSNSKGKGKVVISFASQDELDALFKKLR